jgi:hypothetical protein
MFVAVELLQRLWSCDSRDVYDSDIANSTNLLVRQSFIDYYSYLEGFSINLSSLCHFLLLPDEFASTPTS